MKKSQRIARYIMAGCLCLGIFHEAGIFTAIFALFVFINIDVTSKYFLTLSDNFLQMKKNFDEPFNIPMSDEEKQKLKIEIDEELLKRKSNANGIANTILGDKVEDEK